MFSQAAKGQLLTSVQNLGLFPELNSFEAFQIVFFSDPFIQTKLVVEFLSFTKTNLCLNMQHEVYTDL